MTDYIWIILGMAVVTYIPRVLPFYIVKTKKMPQRLQLFLEFIPYTALGALIMPGALTAVGNHLLASAAGIIVAFVLSWKKGGMILPVLGSIGTTYVLLSLVR